MPASEGFPRSWSGTAAVMRRAFSCGNRLLHKDAAVHVLDARLAAEGHAHVQLAVNDFEATRDAGLRHRAQPVHIGPSDHRTLRAEGDRLEHVLARADAAIDLDL